jgi:hypothetical protein
MQQNNERYMLALFLKCDLIIYNKINVLKSQSLHEKGISKNMVKMFLTLRGVHEVDNANW